MKTLAEVEELKYDSGLEKSYIDYLESYFHELHEALGAGEEIEKFTLENHGQFILLEHGDEVSKLEELRPEYVEQEQLHDGTKVWKLGVLINEDQIEFYFSKVGELDSRLEEWLNECFLESEQYASTSWRESATAKDDGTEDNNEH